MGETVGRLLVALPHPAAADEILDLALRVAARRRLRLHALVREASELTAAAALPFVQEIDRWSGVRHPFDAAAAARAIARLARDCERRLRERAAAQRIDCGLEAVQGSLVREALSALAGSDLLLLGSHAAGWARPVPYVPHRIGVVRDGLDEEAARAIAADLVGNDRGVDTDGIVAMVSAQALRSRTELPGDVDVLVVSRRRATADRATLQRFLVVPRRLVVVLP